MATAPNQLQTQRINNKTYYQGPDGQYYDGLGAPMEDSAPQQDMSPYQSGVTSYDTQSGTTYPYNPLQYATPQTAQALGSQLNLPVSQTQQEYWPTSSPQEQVGGLNAGLVQDTINRYGPPTPGSMSAYLINRDLQPNAGQDQGYTSYYNSPSVQQAIAAQAKPTTAPSATTPPAGTTQAPKPSTGQPSSGGASNTTASNSGIDLTGLQVTPSSYNNAYEGTVKINGVSQRIAVLPDGRVFNSSGQEITSQIPPSDLSSLRSAFSTAAHNPAYQPGSSQPNTGQTNTQTGGQPSGSSPSPIQSGYQPPTAATAPPLTASPNGVAPNAQSGNAPPAYNSFAYNPLTGPGGQPYGGGVAPVFNTTGENVNTQAQNDRNLALQRGEQLGENLGSYTDQQYQTAANFQNQLNSAWAPTANGQGGYSQAQEQSILQQPLLDSLQQTSDEAQQSYLNPQEQAGITGDTGAAYSQLGKDEAGINTAQNTRDAAVRGSVNAEQDNVFGALNSTAGAVRDAYGNTANKVNGALGSGSAATRSYLDPTALNVSQDYLNNEQFGDQDAQDIANKAGRTVGTQNAADEDRLLQQAHASGNTSPLALEAARNRLRQTGAINSADAMTDARIQAKQLALQTTQNRENTRLGAAQNYANLGTGTELNLGQQNVSAQENLGAAQQGAEQYLGSQAQQAQQAVGSARTAAEQNIGQSNIDTSTDLAKTNLAAGTAMDNTNSQRAAQLATNRQAASQYNQGQRYTRGTAAYNAESAANKGFADTQLGQEQQYRTYLGGQQQQAAQGAQVGNQQQIGAYGTQSGAVNSATGNSVSNAKTPDAGSATSIANTAVGAVAALAQGAANGAKAYTAFRKGGVTPGPHMALVGEAGPELVIDLSKVRHDEFGEYPSYPEQPGDDSDSGYAPSTPQAGSSASPNPLWQQLLRQTYSMPSSNPYLQQPQSYAHGGVVTPTDSYLSPGVELVNGPQYRMLGTHGPDAVIPLTPRKGNRVTPAMIPQLVEEYGNYGRA